MKKRFLVFLLALLMLPTALLFTGCRKMDHYRAVVPSDQSFYSILDYSSKNLEDPCKYDFDVHFKVVRKHAVVAGEEREVIYVEYNYNDNLNDYYDNSETLIYVASKSFYLDGNEWKADVSSMWTKWSHVYGAMGKAGTYVEYMTNRIWDRDFPADSKKVTDDYIEYKFKYDEETFKISNNEYHVLLGYHMKSRYEETDQTATLVLGESNFAIAHLDTITAAMLAD